MAGILRATDVLRVGAAGLIQRNLLLSTLPYVSEGGLLQKSLDYAKRLAHYSVAADLAVLQNFPFGETEMKKHLLCLTLALAALSMPGLAVAQPTEDLSRPVAVEIAAVAGLAVHAATELTKGAALTVAAENLGAGWCTMQKKKDDGKGKGGGGKKCLTAKASPDDGDGTEELQARGPGDEGGGEPEPTGA